MNSSHVNNAHVNYCLLERFAVAHAASHTNAQVKVMAVLKTELRCRIGYSPTCRTEVNEDIAIIGANCCPLAFKVGILTAHLVASMAAH